MPVVHINLCIFSMNLGRIDPALFKLILNLIQLLHDILLEISRSDKLYVIVSDKLFEFQSKWFENVLFSWRPVTWVRHMGASFRHYLSTDDVHVYMIYSTALRGFSALNARVIWYGFLSLFLTSKLNWVLWVKIAKTYFPPKLAKNSCLFELFCDFFCDFPVLFRNRFL